MNRINIEDIFSNKTKKKGTAFVYYFPLKTKYNDLEAFYRERNFSTIYNEIYWKIGESKSGNRFLIATIRLRIPMTFEEAIRLSSGSEDTIQVFGPYKNFGPIRKALIHLQNPLDEHISYSHLNTYIRPTIKRKEQSDLPVIHSAMEERIQTYLKISSEEEEEKEKEELKT